MKRTDAFPSRYLSQDDLPAAPETMQVIIVDVLPETMPGETSEEKPVMHFQGDAKPLIVNNTNWLTIEDMYGDESDNWRGKTIELYIDRSITFAGKRVGGIRVRPGTNAGPVAVAAVPAGSDIMWTISQALTALGAVGLNRDDLMKALTNQGHKGWRADRDTGMAKQMIEGRVTENAAKPKLPENDIEEDDIPF